MPEHHIVNVAGLDQAGTVRIYAEDSTSAELHLRVEHFPSAQEPLTTQEAAIYLDADELGQLAAAAAAVRQELAGDAVPVATPPAADQFIAALDRDAAGHAFAECFDVEHYIGNAGWTIGAGPDYSKTGERPRYVRLALADGEPIDLSPAEAAALTGALASRVSELIS